MYIKKRILKIYFFWYSNFSQHRLHDAMENTFFDLNRNGSKKKLKLDKNTEKQRNGSKRGSFEQKKTKIYINC